MPAMYDALLSKAATDRNKTESTSLGITQLYKNLRTDERRFLMGKQFYLSNILLSLTNMIQLRYETNGYI